MCEKKSELVLLDAYVEVEYTIDEPAEENSPSGKYYPVTIINVKLRGESVYRLLHVSHVMMLQRRLFMLLKEEDKI